MVIHSLYHGIILQCSSCLRIAKESVLDGNESTLYSIHTHGQLRDGREGGKGMGCSDLFHLS